MNDTVRCPHCHLTVEGGHCNEKQAQECPNMTLGMRVDRVGQEPDTDAYYANDDQYNT